MAENSSKTVAETIASATKNTVKISLEEYNELVREAAMLNYMHVTYLEKTAQQSATNSYLFGGFFAGLGAVMLVGGLIVVYSGKKKLEL